VWSSIYNDLHPSRKWPSVAVCLLITSVLFFVGYENSNNSSKQPVTAQYKKTPPDKGFNKNQTTPLSNYNVSSNSQQLHNIIGAINTYSIINNNIKNSTNTPVTSFTIDLSLRQNNNLLADNSNYIATDKKGSATSLLTNNESAINAEEENNNAAASETTTTADNNLNSSATSISGIAIAATENAAIKKEETAATANKNYNSISKEDKAWMEAYALHNKSTKARWKDRASVEIYMTPSLGYRIMGSNTKYPIAASVSGQSFAAGNNGSLNHIPSLSAEVGASMMYAFAKKLRVKVGVQFNYSRYGIKAYSTNHPVITTLALNDLNSGYPYLDSRSTTYSNITGDKPATLHNSSIQFSLPVGLDIKIAGQEKIQWSAGATIQPTYVIGSKTFLPSSDKNNYVADNSMVRKLSVNAGFETFISYKMNNGLTLQAGPQLRYQLPSTYGKKFTMDEKLINTGLKIGLVRNF
jgi:hypothetical protein